ncbi:PREDICTED: dispanin subfamily A member 2b-like [Cyprinodon variegatus]|uniref:Dispanin subfamily A member 2b-like n=1 Tax=Cyprinodon variegatus TaxID=28743 RepID=A0A3Q2E7U5_CYPVA|nr:PREDICTED: dispanin subfamily A member 2b-like [Cyprinodon variegatus]
MNPSAPPEALPLQHSGHQWTSGQSGNPGMIQYTTVNIPPEPPKDHLIWSLFNLVYGNICCLGLGALVFSVKARDRKVVGDLSGAQSYSSTARVLNIVATTLMILGILIFIIIFAIQVHFYLAYKNRNTLIDHLQPLYKWNPPLIPQ